MRSPDYAEPIIAWRAWRVVSAGREIRLSSLTYWNVWTPRFQLEASCHRTVFSFGHVWHKKPTGHSAPAESCECGIHGARDARHVAGPLRPPLLHRVIGRVSLWGTIVECKGGWRASHAYPRHIYLPKGGLGRKPVTQVGEIASALSVYGVPVEMVDCDLSSGNAVIAALKAVVPEVLQPRDQPTAVSLNPQGFRETQR